MGTAFKDCIETTLRGLTESKPSADIDWHCLLVQSLQDAISGVARREDLVLLYLPKSLFTKSECKRSSMTWA